MQNVFYLRTSGSPAMRQTLLFCALATLSLGAATASAGVKVELNEGARTCTFTTDQNGFQQLDSAGNMKASGTFGANCGSSSGGGPSITGLDTAPSSFVIGESPAFSLDWSADADNCDYTGSQVPSAGLSWPTSAAVGAACTDAQSCAQTHPHNILPTAAGSHIFALRCFKNGQSTALSKTTQVTAPGGQASCAPPGFTRQLTGPIRAWPNGTSTSVDYTKYETIWGTTNGALNGVALPWPQTYGNLRTITLGANKYAAFKFTVPDSGNAPFGSIAAAESGSTASVATVSISECEGDLSEGDFANRPYCFYTGGAWSSFIKWQVDQGHQTRCNLEPGKSYYLNVKVNCPDCKLSLNPRAA